MIVKTCDKCGRQIPLNSVEITIEAVRQPDDIITTWVNDLNLDLCNECFLAEIRRVSCEYVHPPITIKPLPEAQGLMQVDLGGTVN